MKLILLLIAVAYASADKLDRTYLPPSSSQTAGGSASFLETPNFSRTQNTQEPSRRINNFRNGNQPAHEFQANRFNTAQNFDGPKRFGQNNFAGRNPSSPSFDSNEDNVVINSAVNDFSIEENRPERPQSAFERTAGILRQDSELNGDSYSYSYETENGIFAEESGVATNGVEAQGGFSYTGDDGKVYSITYTADGNGFVPRGEHLPTPPPVPEEILRALEQNAADEAAGIFDDGSYDASKYNDNGDFHGQDFPGAGSENGDAVRTSAAYLPPFPRSNQNQEQYERRPNGASNFGGKSRQSTFNSKDGYQY